MEKCSDGHIKKAKSLGNLKGTWDVRYVVLTKVGVWWFKTKDEYDAGTNAQGCVLELASAEINVRLCTLSRSRCCSETPVCASA
jgi:hypothetical protein